MTPVFRRIFGDGWIFRIRLVLLLCGAAISGEGLPAEISAAVQPQTQLEDIRRSIEALEQVIAETESSHGRESAELRRAERAVSSARRQLLALTKQRTALEAERERLERERREVEERIESRRSELAEWVRRHYIHGGTDLAPLLAARDPNQLARDMHYLEHLGRARLALLEALRDDMAARDALIAESEAQLGKVVELEDKQKKVRAQLEKEQAVRARAVAQLAAHLQAQKHEIERLREDEHRLGQVLAELARQAAERARRTDAPAQTGLRSGGPDRPGMPQLSDGRTFAQLRGRMASPVAGKLTGRFGAPRAEGETTWRGVFISAPLGEEVIAVADGAVVFSDWLRGYGNLIIVDHGDDYLTVYGNNDVLFHNVGDYINAGESLASVGASGGGHETGLYFEIRHRGEPQDPLQWVRLK